MSNVNFWAKTNASRNVLIDRVVLFLGHAARRLRRPRPQVQESLVRYLHRLQESEGLRSPRHTCEIVSC